MPENTHKVPASGIQTGIAVHKDVHVEYIQKKMLSMTDTYNNAGLQLFGLSKYVADIDGRRGYGQSF